MSHFTVLVIGNDPEKQLAPFQENNMGDCPKEYLQFNSYEEEYKKKYEEGKRTMRQLPSGELKETYDDMFKVTITENEYKELEEKKTGGLSRSYSNGQYSHFKTDYKDSKEVDIPFKDLYDTFDKFATGYHGSQRDDETGQYGYWENPNRKWDWYQLGGRWTGFFKVKPLALLGSNDISFNELGFSPAEFLNLVNMFRSEPEKFERVVVKYNGKSQQIRDAVKNFKDEIYPPHTTGSPSWASGPARPGWADQLLRKHIDLDYMRDEAAEKAAIRYDKVIAAIGHTEPNRPWVEIREENGGGGDKAREVYWAQPRLLLWSSLRSAEVTKDEELRDLFMWGNADDYLKTREEYIATARKKAVITFAVIKDGKWYERGSMGWWGMVADEKEEDKWYDEYMKLLDSVDPDTMVSVFDCHI